MRSSRIERIAPGLLTTDYRVTSEETDRYNCIAWALHDTQQWWWCSPRFVCYWPPGVAEDNSLASVMRIFEIHGYRPCEDATHDPSYEKVALYEHPEFGVEHVARQLASGLWTSKIGEWEDIEHSTADALEGEEYGRVTALMKRRRQ